MASGCVGPDTFGLCVVCREDFLPFETSAPPIEGLAVASRSANLFDDRWDTRRHNTNERAETCRTQIPTLQQILQALSSCKRGISRTNDQKVEKASNVPDSTTNSLNDPAA